jgi:transcriptional regulator with GAF, ATPase, and Fis domain
VQKPFDAGEMEARMTARSSIADAPSSATTSGSHERVAGLDDLIGVSAGMRRVFGLIEQVPRADVSVSSRARPGRARSSSRGRSTGGSARAEALLVPVNLAAVPLELLESELFGHVRGAFTGAVAERSASSSSRTRGTLFLDEVGDAPLALQPKLLRVLQDGVVERGRVDQRGDVDVRLVGDQPRPRGEDRGGRFRADLFYRLRVIQIEMPPLRDRREDIPLPPRHFLRSRAGGARSSTRITEAALRLLEDTRGRATCASSRT